jgi:bifunctional DNA-binding transcriptional regulator/antitoxin component of YhaV-PrlF toxin-antitoxin module
MSQAGNSARLGTYSELSQRYLGTVLPAPWLEAAGVGVGEEVALDQEGDQVRVFLEGDWPANPDWVEELKTYGSSTALHLPPMAATILGVDEAGDALAQRRDADGDTVVLSGIRS